MLKKMATISYAQLLASLRGQQAESQPTSEPKDTEVEATTETITQEQCSEDNVNGPDDSEIVAEEVETAEATKDPEAESDIASSRSQSPVPRPITPPPQTVSRPLETALSTPKPPDSPKPPTEERKEPVDEEQKYQAKVIILDLLGWGVSPDYMLQRGISHDLICCVFNELRLRLPENIAADYAAIANTRPQQ